MMCAVKSSGSAPVNDTHMHDTCNGIFGKCLRSGQLLSESDEKKRQKNLQKLIQDGAVYASNVFADEPFAHTTNRIFGKNHLEEVNTFTGKGKVAPHARARKFQLGIVGRAKKLDLEFPGSNFEETLRTYGDDGKYLVLVAGPFSNLSGDFGVLVDFLARVGAVRLLNTWETKPGQALALNRQILLHKFGHLVTLLSEPRRVN